VSPKRPDYIPEATLHKDLGRVSVSNNVSYISLLTHRGRRLFLEDVISCVQNAGYSKVMLPSSDLVDAIIPGL
jgi:hypothetical protein